MKFVLKDLKRKKLLIQRLSTEAVHPRKCSPGSAGLDLYSTCEVIVPSGGSAAINTGIAVKLPKGTYGRLASRSGLAMKKNVHVAGGVIDRDFRGSIVVILLNHSPEDFKVEKHKRICQLIVEKMMEPKVVFVKKLPGSTRGTSGLGSSGLDIIDGSSDSGSD